MSITVEALGEARFSASTRGHSVFCDLSPESGGGDTGMTPTELFLSALGCCVGLYIVRFCDRRGIPTKGMKIQVSREGAQNPSRIGRILFEVEMPSPVPEERREEIIAVAKRCYLHNTLNNPPEMNVLLK
ncbi:MAG: OsmC family protein [Candidatus Bathyarchaeia archaeon]